MAALVFLVLLLTAALAWAGIALRDALVDRPRPVLLQPDLLRLEKPARTRR